MRIGDFASALWFAVSPNPLSDNEISFLTVQKREEEIAYIGNSRYWVMGRIENPNWKNPYALSDVVVKETSDKTPDLLTRDEYRFKIVRTT